MFDDVFGLVDSMMNVDSFENASTLSEADVCLDYPLTEPLTLLGPMPPDLPGSENQMPSPPLEPESIEQEVAKIHKELEVSSQETVELELEGLPESAIPIESKIVSSEMEAIYPDSGDAPKGLADIAASNAETLEIPPYSASQPFAAGDWAGDASTWHLQEAPNSCAIACQADVLNSFGIEVEEGQIAELAQERGWYEPRQGTDPKALGHVVEAFGIPVTQSYDTSLVEIKDALDDGRKVMVGLDANEIWEPRKDVWGNPLEQPDGGHAVWVTGIEESPAGDLEVILNDTGHEAGRASRVAMHDFLNAWDDFGRHAAVTDISPGGIHA
jgi:Peptidase_C39 like family